MLPENEGAGRWGQGAGLEMEWRGWLIFGAFCVAYPMWMGFRGIRATTWRFWLEWVPVFIFARILLQLLIY